MYNENGVILHLFVIMPLILIQSPNKIINSICKLIPYRQCIGQFVKGGMGFSELSYRTFNMEMHYFQKNIVSNSSYSCLYHYDKMGYIHQNIILSN